LEREEWKTIPWEDDPESRTSKDRLTDILVDIPGLVEDCDNVFILEQKQSGPAISQRARITQKTGELMARLIEWRLGFEREFPNCCYEVNTDPGTSLSVDAKGVLFPTILHYRSLSEAADIMLYDSSLLMLLNINQFTTGQAFVFDTKVTETVQRTNPLYLPGETSSFREIALEICRSIEYHMLPIHSNAGSFFTLFPARVAYFAMSRTSREAVWIESILQMVANISGFEVSKTILMEYPGEYNPENPENPEFPSAKCKGIKTYGQPAPTPTTA
jgi:hypothetical protein